MTEKELARIQCRLLMREERSGSIHPMTEDEAKVAEYIKLRRAAQLFKSNIIDDKEESRRDTRQSL